MTSSTSSVLLSYVKSRCRCSMAHIGDTILVHQERTVPFLDFHSIQFSLWLSMHGENTTSHLGRNTQYQGVVPADTRFQAIERRIFGASSIRLLPFNGQSGISFNVTLTASHVCLDYRKTGVKDYSSAKIYANINSSRLSFISSVRAFNRIPDVNPMKGLR